MRGLVSQHQRLAQREKKKMAPRTAFRCSSFCLFLVVNYVSACFYTREELLSIRSTTPMDLVPVFLASAAELALILVKKVRRRRRGKRAGVLVRLRRLGTRTPIPGILLSNVHSLSNKMDDLALLLRRNRDFSASPVLCFTETWLSELVPDCAMQLKGFKLLRSDREKDLSGGETGGGGVCFYINNAWSSDVTVISKHCSPDLEYLFINCKPFYPSREFASFILAVVYIPPSANVHVAQRALADQILSVERTFPDSLCIIMGDFNKGNLSHELPKYTQFIKVPTREQNTPDHCYTTVSNAFRAMARAAMGFSDHAMVHLIPTYRQNLHNISKPVVRTSKKWTNEAVEELRACLDITDWEVFRAATDSLDEYTDTVMSYIRFCEDSIIPTHTKVTFNNDKPWFTSN